MGEAKRRKAILGDAYGKKELSPKVILGEIPHNLRKSHRIITISDAAKLLFEEFGRGMVVWNRPGFPFAYILPTYADITDLDKSFIESYDPNTEFYLSYPLTDHVNNEYYSSSIYRRTSEEGQLRVLIPNDKDFQFPEKQIFR